MENLRRVWSRSKWFRVALIITSAYVLLRLAVQVFYIIATASSSELLPDWASEGGPEVPIDLQVYLDAATHFDSRQDLYLQDSLDRIEYHFPYPPSYAMVFIPFLWLSPLAVTIVHTLIHIAAYVVMYVYWGRIFRRLHFDRAGEMLAWTLPVWLVFAAFWGDLGYLNIYIIMALLATLLIDAVLNERLGWSLVWLSIILQTKPMWAFAAAIPLLLGRYRFFFKLLGLALIVYLATAGTTILIAGLPYGWQQYVDYFNILSRLGNNFPWREPTAPFLGYNHSIKQVIIYVLGSTPGSLLLATVVKVLLLVPLAVMCLRLLTRPTRRAGRDVPKLALELAFALYTAAFIWLDIVWELSLGIAVFTYLLAVSDSWKTNGLIWAAFLPYALVDFFQVAGFIALGTEAILPGPYIVTDPSIYAPLITIVILAFHAVLVKRLWGNLRAIQVKGA